MRIKTKVWLEKEGKLILGSGKVLILKSIASTGSINKAAEKIKMSYRHAWSCIRAIEGRIGRPVVKKTKGGRGGGGATLTEDGKDLVRKFERLEQEIKSFSDKRFKEIFLQDGKIHNHKDKGW
ncbi:winged helix-turn-helix domain-containing protein [Candidatus Omnitrophota bacterium]